MATARPWDALAASALVLLPVGLPLARGTTPGLLAALALAPLWLGTAVAVRGARVLLGLGALALAVGALQPAALGLPQDTGAALETGLLVLTGLLCVGVVLWARTRLPLRHVTALLGTGLVLQGLLALPAEEPWKTGLGAGVGLLVLSLVPPRAGPVPGVLALLALAAVDVALGSRAAFGLSLLAALLVAWSGLPARPAPAGAVARVVVLLVAATAALGWLGTRALLDGRLGEDVQARSVQQVRTSGSLVLGGRPEWAATLALAREQPLGYGLGVTPGGPDVRRAREALAGVGLAPDPARDSYMFGGTFRLHAVAADLWASLGLAGLALALTSGVLLLRGLARGLVRRDAPPAVVLAVVTALWHLPFGTLFSNLVQVSLALGLVLPLPRSDMR